MSEIHKPTPSRAQQPFLTVEIQPGSLVNNGQHVASNSEILKPPLFLFPLIADIQEKSKVFL